MGAPAAAEARVWYRAAAAAAAAPAAGSVVVVFVVAGTAADPRARAAAGDLAGEVSGSVEADCPTEAARGWGTVAEEVGTAGAEEAGLAPAAADHPNPTQGG